MWPSEEKALVLRRYRGHDAERKGRLIVAFDHDRCLKDWDKCPNEYKNAFLHHFSKYKTVELWSYSNRVSELANICEQTSKENRPTENLKQLEHFYDQFKQLDLMNGTALVLHNTFVLDETANSLIASLVEPKESEVAERIKRYKKTNTTGADENGPVDQEMCKCIQAVKSGNALKEAMRDRLYQIYEGTKESVDFLFVDDKMQNLLRRKDPTQESSPAVKMLCFCPSLYLQYHGKKKSKHTPTIEQMCENTKNMIDTWTKDGSNPNHSALNYPSLQDLLFQVNGT